MRHLPIAVLLFALLINSQLHAQWVHVGGPYGQSQAIATDGKNIFVGGRHNYLFRSSNNGVTWNKLLAPGNIIALTMCQERLFAECYEDGIYSSSNAGADWTHVASPNANTGQASLSANDSTLFWSGDPPWGIFRSTDFGLSWIRSTTGLTDTMVGLVANSDSGVIAITSLASYRSLDNGVTWAFLDSAHWELTSNLLILGNAWLRTGHGLERSFDHGKTWTTLSELGITNTAMVGLCQSATDLFIVTTFGSVFRSKDSGQSWKAAGLTPMEVHGLVNLNGKLFIASFGSGVSVSSDEGQTWSLSNNGLASRYALDSRRITTLGPNIFLATDTGVYRSSNTGSSWTAVGLGHYQITAIHSFGRYIFAGAGNWPTPHAGGQLYRSSDFGESWDSVNSMMNGMIIFWLASERGLLFASADSGIFRSSDSGVSWQQVAPKLGTQVVASDAGALFAGGAVTQGLFRSTNDGVTWDTVDAELRVYDMLIVGKTVFVSSDYQAMVSYDLFGSTPTKVDSGIDGIGANWLGSDGHYLFTSVRDGGLFRRPLNEMLSVEERRAELSTERCFPNPCTHSLTVQGLNEPRTTVFDALGRLCTLPNDHGVVDVSSLPSGLYYINDGTQRARFVKQ